MKVYPLQFHKFTKFTTSINSYTIAGFHIVENSRHHQCMMSRLLEQSEAVITLRKLFREKNISKENEPKEVCKRAAFFKKQSLDNFRAKLKRKKQNLGEESKCSLLLMCFLLDDKSMTRRRWIRRRRASTEQKFYQQCM